MSAAYIKTAGPVKRTVTKSRDCVRLTGSAGSFIVERAVSTREQFAERHRRLLEAAL